MKPVLDFLCATFWFIPFIIHLFLVDLILSITLLVSTVVPSLHRPIFTFNCRIANLIWNHTRYIFLQHGPRITTSGDFESIPMRENALLISNHLSYTDFFWLQTLAQAKGMLGCDRYFAKKSIRWIPILGWGFAAVDMPMVSRNWTTDRAEFLALFGKMKTSRNPMWLASFCEGTRFTQKKWEAMRDWALSKGKPVLKHCLYPRTKGFVTCVRELRDDPHIQHVYDMTIVNSYDNGNGKRIFQTRPPNIWDFFSQATVSPPWKFHIHVERFALKDLPQDDAGVAVWLENRWFEKDKILEGLRSEWTAYAGLGAVSQYRGS